MLWKQLTRAYVLLSYSNQRKIAKKCENCTSILKITSKCVNVQMSRLHSQTQPKNIQRVFKWHFRGRLAHRFGIKCLKIKCIWAYLIGFWSLRITNSCVWSAGFEHLDFLCMCLECRIWKPRFLMSVFGVLILNC